MEGLVQLCQHLSRFGFVRSPPIGEPRFVDALEHQLIRVVLKLRRNLCPSCIVAGQHLIMLLLHPADPQPGIMMKIDHHIQLLVQCPVHYLLNSGEISSFYSIVRGRANMNIPGHRNADAFVSLVGDALDQFRSDLRIAP
ncbi:hypothetical protein D3C75_991040 [compost metagenome]